MVSILRSVFYIVPSVGPECLSALFGVVPVYALIVFGSEFLNPDEGLSAIHSDFQGLRNSPSHCFRSIDFA